MNAQLRFDLAPTPLPARRCSDVVVEPTTPLGPSQYWAALALPFAAECAAGPRAFAALMALGAGAGIKATHVVCVLSWLENEGLATSGRGKSLTLTARGVRFLNDHHLDADCRCGVCRRMKQAKKEAER